MKNYFTDGTGVETFWKGQDLKDLQNKIAKIREGGKEPICEIKISENGKRYLTTYKRKNER